MHLTHLNFIRIVAVFLHTHPGRPGGLGPPHQVIARAEPLEETASVCPYCGVGCNLDLHIKDDYIYNVTSPFDSVVNHGNLCVKGRFGYDFIYSEERLKTPLIREGDGFREASWDEALDAVADKMGQYQADQFGMIASATASNAASARSGSSERRCDQVVKTMVSPSVLTANCVSAT